MSGINKIMNNISVNFRLPGIKREKANVSNPFGISFKGHIYKADLYESSTSKNKLSFAAKLVDIKDNFINKMASIGHYLKTQMISFGSKVSNFSDKISEKTIEKLNFRGNIDNSSSKNVSKEAQKLAKRPVAELEEMLNLSIAAREEVKNEKE